MVIPVILAVMKVAISIPDELHARADEAAARLGLNRSQLYARSVEEFLAANGEDPVTAALDALADDPHGAASAGVAAGRALIDARRWEW